MNSPFDAINELLETALLGMTAIFQGLNAQEDRVVHNVVGPEEFHVPGHLDTQPPLQAARESELFALTCFRRRTLNWRQKMLSFFFFLALTYFRRRTLNWRHKMFKKILADNYASLDQLMNYPRNWHPSEQDAPSPNLNFPPFSRPPLCPDWIFPARSCRGGSLWDQICPVSGGTAKKWTASQWNSSS